MKNIAMKVIRVGDVLVVLHVFETIFSTKNLLKREKGYKLLS